MPTNYKIGDTVRVLEKYRTVGVDSALIYYINHIEDKNEGDMAIAHLLSLPAPGRTTQTLSKFFYKLESVNLDNESLLVLLGKVYD